MTLVSRVEYENAEARGRVRQWKKRLEREYLVFNRGFLRLQGGDLRELPIDLVRCGRVGRRRACEKISAALGPGARLELSTLDGPHPHAVWSIYKPRDSVVYDAPPDEHGSLFQNCITVNYFVAGALPGMIGIAEGLWTLEVPDHALGRAVERSRFLHPEAIIREAHVNLLALPASIVANRPNFIDHDSPGLYIKAGPGCFTSHFYLALDISIGDQYGAHVRVKTWLSDDQLGDDQIALSEKGNPGDCLSDGWLLPRPFARIIRTNQNQFDVAVWRP